MTIIWTLYPVFNIYIYVTQVVRSNNTERVYVFRTNINLIITNIGYIGIIIKYLRIVFLCRYVYRFLEV